MKIICTACSKHKRDDAELLPAKLRYLGSHIILGEEQAKEMGVPFFILSGKYGVISADEKIPNYDYYLVPEKVDEVADLIAAQLREHKVTEIIFYAEGKDSWAPYRAALQKGAEMAGAKVDMHIL
jgi:hypothetical protein